MKARKKDLFIMFHKYNYKEKFMVATMMDYNI